MYTNCQMTSHTSSQFLLHTIINLLNSAFSLASLFYRFLFSFFVLRSWLYLFSLVRDLFYRYFRVPDACSHQWQSLCASVLNTCLLWSESPFSWEQTAWTSSFYLTLTPTRCYRSTTRIQGWSETAILHTFHEHSRLVDSLNLNKHTHTNTQCLNVKTLSDTLKMHTY